MVRKIAYGIGLAGLLLLGGCSTPSVRVPSLTVPGFTVPSFSLFKPAPGPAEVVASDEPFPPPLDHGLDKAAAAGDPIAIGALVEANPAFAERIVAFAVSAHPRNAAAIAAAAAAAQPDLAPRLAAAAAMANPVASVEIAGHAAAAVPARSAEIAEAVTGVLQPAEQQLLETKIAAAVEASAPQSVDDWSLEHSSKR